MTSWMMSLWLKHHEKSEWPDLSISQPEDACHVSIKDENQSERAIEEMCSEGFFTVHGYRYVEWDATAERVPEELYDDLKGKDCTQSCSDLQDEDPYEEPDRPFACQLRGGCHLRSPQERPDPNASSIDPRYKNVRVDVTKTDLQEEEAYEEIAGQLDDCLLVTKEVVDLKDVSTEPRYQNVQIDVTKTDLQEEEPQYDDVRSLKGVVDMKVVFTKPRYRNINVQIDATKAAVNEVTEVPSVDEVYDDIACEEQIEQDESEIYEEIGNQSPASCHSASTDERSKNVSSESYLSCAAEEAERETTDAEDDELYEEIEGAVISNSVEACSLKRPGNTGFNGSAEAVGCGVFIPNPENSSVAAEGEALIHDDPVYAEIGILQLADRRLNRNTGCQSTTGNPDTTGYRELMPREYMSLRGGQASNLNSKDTSPAKKDVAKLNNRRRHCDSKDTTENHLA